jgi:hypothetical protein
MYQLTYKDHITGELHTMTKLKGFFIQSQKGREIVHDNVFKGFVEGYLRGEKMEAKLGQWQIKTTKSRRLKSTITQKVLKNSIFNKRVAFIGQEHSSTTTLPYGFTEKMYNDIFT